MTCVLCEGIADDFTNIQRHYEELNIQITLFETKNFKVIPDKFPITDNHIIILPKKHINTFAEFNSIEAEEVRQVLDYLQLKTKSNSFIMFEHGTSKREELTTAPSIKSIFHAHLHFIPDVKCDTDDMAIFFKKKNVELLNLDGSKELIDKYETPYSGNGEIVNFFRNNVIYEDRKNNSIESYLYIKNSNNTQLFFPERLITPQLPSQFLREALSIPCDTPEWNWKIPMSTEGRKKYASRIFNMVKLFSKSKEPRVLAHSNGNFLSDFQNTKC